MTRKALLWVVMLVVAMPVVAQEHPLADRAKGEVIRFLALTPEQVTEWDGLLTTRHDALVPLREQLRAVEEQLRGLLEQPSPDPTAVGNLVLQGKGLKDQIETANKAYLDGFEGMLGAEQNAKLHFLRRAERAEPLFPPFRLFGLLPPLLEHKR